MCRMWAKQTRGSDTRRAERSGHIRQKAPLPAAIRAFARL